MYLRAVIVVCVAFLSVMTAGATIAQDSVRGRQRVALHVEEPADTTAPEHNIFKRIIAYFDDANKPKSNKRYDVSFIGGPHFSSDTKLGLGLVAAGNYRHDRSDTLTIPSNVSLYGDVSTVGFYLLGLRGTHLFPHDRYRIEYNLYFYSFPTNFWGIGYEMGKNDENKSKFKQFCFKGSVWGLKQFAPGLFAGVGAEYNRIEAHKVVNPELWEGEAMRTNTTGLGVKIQYDTRDSHTEPYSGWLTSVEQKFCPGFLGNKYAFSFTAVRASHYRKVWKGGILAGLVNGRFAYGDVPWGMLSTFSSSSGMRGYYEGRYRDKCEVDLTLELRQHIWHRIGAVAWVGAGTVAPSLGEMRWRKVLPCVGVGYRWEFKKRCNVRLDFGIGRGETSFMFNINEAF